MINPIKVAIEAAMKPTISETGVAARSSDRISWPMSLVPRRCRPPGGSKGSKTFNVSTVVSLLATAAGAKVVKHGNKAVTSKSGSADLLEKLGVNIEMSTDKSFEIFNKLGFTFLYARKFHSAMRFVAPVRVDLGFRTLFNLIGPLSNPAHATHQIIGVFDKENREKWGRAWGFIEDDRVSNLVPADYSKSSALSISLMMATENIAKRIKLRSQTYQG